MPSYAIVSTMADLRRPAVTYKIEFEDDERLDSWLDTKWLLEEVRRQWNQEDRGANTALIVFYHSGKVEVRKLLLRWDQVTVLLETADELQLDTYRGRGRPSRRVLMATTSKERRYGSQAAY